MPSNQPCDEVAHRLAAPCRSRPAARTSVSAMMLVAAVVETSTCASSPRAVDGAREVRLPGHRGVDLLGLERGGGRGRLLVKTMFFSIAARSSGERPDCESRYSSNKCDGVNLRGRDLLALQILDRLDASERDDAVAAARPVLLDDRLGLLMFCSARSDASRAQESTVSHMMSMSPLMNAPASRPGPRSARTSRPGRTSSCRARPALPGSMPPLETMPGAWPAQVLMRHLSGRLSLPLPTAWRGGGPCPPCRRAGRPGAGRGKLTEVVLGRRARVLLGSAGARPLLQLAAVLAEHHEAHHARG